MTIYITKHNVEINQINYYENGGHEDYNSSVSYSLCDFSQLSGLTDLPNGT